MPLGGIIKGWSNVRVGTSFLRCSYINTSRAKHWWSCKNNQRWREDNVLYRSDWQNFFMGYTKRLGLIGYKIHAELPIAGLRPATQSSQRCFLRFGLLHRSLSNRRKGRLSWQNIILCKPAQSQIKEPSRVVPKARDRGVDSSQPQLGGKEQAAAVPAG